MVLCGAGCVGSALVPAACGSGRAHANGAGGAGDAGRAAFGADAACADAAGVADDAVDPGDAPGMMAALVLPGASDANKQ